MSIPIKCIQAPEDIKKFTVVENPTGLLKHKVCYRQTYWFHVYGENEVSKDLIKCFPEEISQLFWIKHEVENPVVVAATGTTKGIELAGPSILLTRAKEFFKEEDCNLLITGHGHPNVINLLLYYFARYPTFEGYYRTYCSDPDNHVPIKRKGKDVTLEEAVNWIIDIEVSNTKTSETKFTQAEVGLTAHFLMLSDNKNFFEGAGSTHVADFSRQRKQAFLRGQDVEMKNLVSPDVILAWSKWMQNLPKLKACLFYVVASNISFQECSMAMELLCYGGMTIVDVTTQFIECSPKTVAHRHPVVLKEMN